MLRLILGRAGSGKTEWIRNLLAELARTGHQRLILLVPEQFSFESERAVLEQLGPRDAQRVEILSFTRLADAVRREAGGLCGQRLNDGGRAILMSLALEGVRDKLSLYARHAQSAALASELMQVSSEFKQCAVTPQELETAANAMKPCVLRQKMQELSWILSAYDALVAQRFFDDRDDLTRLAEVLERYHFFAGRTVAVDAFKGFTVQERLVLRRIMAQADELYVTLCADTLREEQGGAGTFSLVRRTGNRLIEEAKRQDVRVAAPVVLEDSPRFREPALAALEKGAFSPDADVFSGDASCVTICAAQDRTAECEWIAATAKRLMREEGFRCREMAVLVRQEEAYRPELTAALKKYEIPVFEDARQPVDSQPLIALTRSALAAINGFRTDAVLQFLKTGLAGFSVEEISELENYVLLWKLSGAQWHKDWTSHPDGFVPELTPEDRMRLDHINELRRRADLPLSRLKKACCDADGEQIASAVYRFLLDVGADEQVRLLTAELDACGEVALAQEQARVWDMLMEILNQSATALRGHSLTAERFASLFDLVLRVQDLGTIPQGLDELTIGGVDRVRVGAPRVVFLAGANEGVFPATPAAGGLLTDAERRRLIEAGLEVADPCEFRAVEEQFLAYNALSAASERLYVSFARADTAGTAMTQSVLVAQVQRILPGCWLQDTASPGLLSQIESTRAAFSEMARCYRENSKLSASLLAYFSQLPAYEGRLEAVHRAAQAAPIRFENPKKATDLFGKNLSLSASRIETFYRCKFRYFCQYGMNAQPRKTAELDPMQSGTVIHAVLERLLREFGGKGLCGLSAQQRRDAVERLLRAYLEEQMGSMPEQTGRFQYLVSRLARTLDAVCERLAQEFQGCAYEPADFELKIGTDGEINPYRVELPDGTHMEVHGVVDRVDTMQRGGKTYLRIVDYKSGGKSFQLSDVMQGLNMQMLLYLLCLWENGAQRYGEVVPAGILYMPARLSIPGLPRNASQKETESARAKTYKMSGMLLKDFEAVTGMEQEGAGMFIPAKTGKDGGLTGTLISLEQLGQLEKQVDSVLREMGTALHQGEIPAVPAQGTDYPDVCALCDYRSVCGHEQCSPVRTIEKFKHEDVLKQLKGGEADGAQLDAPAEKRN